MSNIEYPFYVCWDREDKYYITSKTFVEFKKNKITQIFLKSYYESEETKITRNEYSIVIEFNNWRIDLLDKYYNSLDRISQNEFLKQKNHILTQL